MSLDERTMRLFIENLQKSDNEQFLQLTGIEPKKTDNVVTTILAHNTEEVEKEVEERFGENPFEPILVSAQPQEPEPEEPPSPEAQANLAEGTIPPSLPTPGAPEGGNEEEIEVEQQAEPKAEPVEKKQETQEASQQPSRKKPPESDEKLQSDDGLTSTQRKVNRRREALQNLQSQWEKKQAEKAGGSNQDFINSVRQQLLQSRQNQFTGPGLHQFGGQLPAADPRAIPRNSEGATESFADAAEQATASATSAFEKVAMLLLQMSARLREIERTLDEAGT